MLTSAARAFAILAAALAIWGIDVGGRWLLLWPLPRRADAAATRYSPAHSEWPKGEIPYPRGASVIAQSDRTRFFLGENPLVHLTVTNVSSRPFWIFDGGDYRGGTRSWRFRIKVRDALGDILPDPMPEQLMMGGMGQYHFLRPGERHTYSALLSRYALIDRSGSYEVEVRHDLGTRRFAGPGRLSPASRFSITILEPSPDQAREIAAKAGGLKWAQQNSRSEDMIEWGQLSAPAFLPFVDAALRRGDADALLALGHARGADATWRLIGWVGDAGSTYAIRSHAFKLLAARAPLQDSARWNSAPVLIAPALLREGAWTRESRHAALSLARERVKLGFALEGEEATAAAILIGALGDAHDAGHLLTLWRELMGQHRRQPGGVSTAWGPAGYALVAALDQLRGRGWNPPVLGADEGDVHLWLALGEHEKARGPLSAEVKLILFGLLEDSDPRIRSRAHEALQSPVRAP